MVVQRYFDLEAPTFVVSLNEKEQHKEEIAKMIYGHFIPHKAVIWRRDADEELRDLVPSSRHMPCVEGRTTLYICTRTCCLEPISDLSKMWETLSKI